MAENAVPVHPVDVVVNFYRTEVLTGEEAKHFTKSDLAPSPKVTECPLCLNCLTLHTNWITAYVWTWINAPCQLATFKRNKPWRRASRVNSEFPEWVSWKSVMSKKRYTKRINNVRRCAKFLLWKRQLCAVFNLWFTLTLLHTESQV